MKKREIKELKEEIKMKEEDLVTYEIGPMEHLDTTQEMCALVKRQLIALGYKEVNIINPCEQEIL